MLAGKRCQSQSKNNRETKLLQTTGCPKKVSHVQLGIAQEILTLQEKLATAYLKKNVPCVYENNCRNFCSTGKK